MQRLPPYNDICIVTHIDFGNNCVGNLGYQLHKVVIYTRIHAYASLLHVIIQLIIKYSTVASIRFLLWEKEAAE